MTDGVTAIHEVQADTLRGAVESRLREGFRIALVCGVEDVDCFRVVYVLARGADDQRIELVLRTPLDAPTIPSLAGIDYPTGRFEREIRDLYGITPIGHPLPARLVRHGHWPRGWYPMRRDAGSPSFEPDVGSFPFLEVEGEGVYEIPVGPVHAGIIEPGHFRFSVVGETILRMKARLWFVHRGVEKLFEGRRPADGIELAERISGDTAVGHATAYAMAVEAAAGIEVDEQDRLVPSAPARAGTHAQPRRRPRCPRQRRRLRDHPRPRLPPPGDPAAAQQADDRPPAAARRNHDRRSPPALAPRTQDRGVRSRGGGRAGRPDRCQLDRARPVHRNRVLSRDAAIEIGTLGYVARASGVDIDARRDHPFIDLGDSFSVVVEPAGDVLARYNVRVREFDISARVVRDLVARLGGDHRARSGRRPATGR